MFMWISALSLAFAAVIGIVVTVENIDVHNVCHPDPYGYITRGFRAMLVLAFESLRSQEISMVPRPSLFPLESLVLLNEVDVLE